MVMKTNYEMLAANEVNIFSIDFSDIFYVKVGFMISYISKAPVDQQLTE